MSIDIDALDGAAIREHCKNLCRNLLIVAITIA